MSTTLETRNYGSVQDFGFWGPDTTKIMLGELPAVSVGQFCRYATATIKDAYSLSSSSEKRELSDTVKGCLEWASERNFDKGIRSTQTLTDFPRLMYAENILKELDNISPEDEKRRTKLMEEYLIAVNISGKEVIDYEHNPFMINGTAVVIGGKYAVDFVEFARFAATYIGGGVYGWDSRGVPDYAAEALENLREIISK